jgi:hypothetical protein
VKPTSKPDTGIPFDAADPMFNTPPPRRASAFSAGQAPPGDGDGEPPAPSSEVRCLWLPLTARAAPGN